MKYMSYPLSQMTGHLDGANRALDPWVPLRFRKRNVGGETHANSAPNDPKLSDPARGTHGLQPGCDGRVRCSAWLGVIGFTLWLVANEWRLNECPDGKEGAYEESTKRGECEETACKPKVMLRGISDGKVRACQIQKI